MLILLTLTLFTSAFFPSIKAQSGSPTVSLSPATTQVTQVNQYVYLTITISDVQNLWSWDCNITWDPTVLTLVGSAIEGSFLQQGGDTLFLTAPLSRTGTGEQISDTLESQTGASGDGLLATIEFQVTAQSPSTTVQLVDQLEAPPTYDAASTLYNIITQTSTTSTATINYAAGGAPAANAGPDQTVQQGATVTFDGSKSLSSGTGTTYAWSFTYNGATQSLTGANPTFAFTIPGIYVVTLVVTDSNGASTPATVTITVNSNSKPVAVIAVEGVSQGQVQSGQEITFNGTGSSEANGGTIAKYLWSAKLISQTTTGGTTSQPPTSSATIGSTATLTYNFTLSTTSGLKSQTYNVTLTVFDATNQNNNISTQITVVPSTNTSPTSTPTTTTSTSSTPTSTPSDTSTATTNPTSTPTSNDNPQGGLPPDILTITIIITIFVLAGSTVWLRKRT